MITSINTYRIINEKKKKNSGIDLVVCDVQKAFQEYFGEEYLEEVYDYCKDFQRVFQIWDSNKNDSHDYVFANQVKTYEKKYGGELKLENVEQYFPEAMWTAVKQKMDEIPNAGDLFETIYGDTWVYVDGRHKWFLCSKELTTLFKNFADQKREVILIGGAFDQKMMSVNKTNKMAQIQESHEADGECGTDIYVAMKSFGVNVSINDRYVYTAKGSLFM